MIKSSVVGLLLAVAPLVLWLDVVATEVRPQQVTSCELGLIRLPETFVPQHYNLKIQPDLGALTFEGAVKIHVTKVAKKPGTVTQRIGNLLITGAKYLWTYGRKEEEDLGDRRIILNVGQSIQPTSIEVFPAESALEDLATGENCLDEKAQMLRINLKRDAKIGEAFKIRIKYTGVIGEESRGFFKSEHVNPADSKKYTNAMTHFFPADARSAFPCFDEPEYKASFKLSVVHLPKFSVISNAPIRSNIMRGDGMVDTTFKQTMKMSTYNFAFAIGRYDKVPCKHRANVIAHVPVGRTKNSQFIVDTICKAIDVGESYFNKRFPLEKLDIVVTKRMREPSRENWGMLVITEDFMYVNDDTTNVLRAEITKLAVHIVLHQWWGDLVSAKWWDDQWIFDGFTTWQSHWATAKIYPEFDYDFNYLLRLQSPMLDAHTNSSAHAVKTYEALDADQEMALFDSNTYNKAAAIYQMFNSAFRPGLQRGLIRLLNSHAFGSVDAKDFFEVVGKAAHHELEPMLKSWLDQPGVPLVRVRLVSGMIELIQSRLVDKPTRESERQSWIIPIKYHTSVDGKVITKNQVFTKGRETVTPLPDWFNPRRKEQWIKLNTNFDGFYRVQYDNDLLRRLRAPVENKVLPPADRFNIIDDLRALLRLGRVDVSLVEEVLGWYTKETHGGVISGLARVIPVLGAAQKIAGRDSRATRKVVFSLFEHVFEESKLEVNEGESHAEMNGRQDALLALVAYNHHPTVDEALKVFDSSDVHLTPFLRKPVYLAVINHGSDDQFKQLVQRLRGTKSSYERQLLVASLVSRAANRERAKLVRKIIVQS